MCTCWRCQINAVIYGYNKQFPEIKDKILSAWCFLFCHFTIIISFVHIIILYMKTHKYMYVFLKKVHIYKYVNNVIAIICGILFYHQLPIVLVKSFKCDQTSMIFTTKEIVVWKHIMREKMRHLDIPEWSKNKAPVYDGPWKCGIIKVNAIFRFFPLSGTTCWWWDQLYRTEGTWH